MPTKKRKPTDTPPARPDPEQESAAKRPAPIDDTTRCIIRANVIHTYILRSARSTLISAIRVGENLTALKATLSHRKWREFLITHFPFTARTAALYMQLYERQDEILSKADLLSGLTLQSIHRLLRKPKHNNSGTGPAASGRKLDDAGASSNPAAAPTGQNQGDHRDAA